MRLIVAIVDDRDVDKVMTALTGQHISVTHVSSTGGLFAPSNATLLIGLDDPQVPQAMNVIHDLAASRQSFAPITYEGTISSTGVAEIQVGGFMSFVLAVDHFEQV
jgi:uncharacterized protein YaaQ